MFSAIAQKIFGTNNDRILKPLWKKVENINNLEEKYSKLSDQDLKNQTIKFKEQLKSGLSLDDILEDSFAVVREAAKRTLGFRHYDVQLIGGMVLHNGMISEMKTGEGKTLSSTLAAYLNALDGKGVHIVTVNDYLAKRDSEWMSEIYKFLGLTVGCITNELDDEQRKSAYNCDITYGTNNEFGFDYLRDNMKFSMESLVQKHFHFAIIDEVDSILIDEARTPLIISGPTEDNSELYIKIDKLIPLLKEEDYEIDEKSKSITLTEDGNSNAEQILRDYNILKEDENLYDITSISIVHHLNQSLRAHKLFKLDTDYIVKDNKVILIDEFTGRMMEGRRFSEGLHQALEAKEKVTIQNENQTLASITFQNYFKGYNKLSGMTGTASTEANEFIDIYGLIVVEIPTNNKIQRDDKEDEIYRTSKERDEAILEQIKDCYNKKQPVLVGTISIERSEYYSKLLKQNKIPHNVLNARHHEKEAEIIAEAGQLGKITIATNMAGRGTDIVLGGTNNSTKQDVINSGGLYVLGTERHESRRIDNQLRGRSGRQGDPGETKFFLSLEDDLLRIFGSDRISGMMSKLGMKEGESIIHPWITRAIEKAQMRVEQHNYEIRKNLLKFDNVMNDQRKVIYEQRIEIMEAKDLSETVDEFSLEQISNMISTHIPARSYPEQWDINGLEIEFYRIFGINHDIKNYIKNQEISEEGISEFLKKGVEVLFNEKINKYGIDICLLVQKQILLVSLDQSWKDHLHSLDNLRQGINLRAYGQKDPLNEYKKEAFQLFNVMLDNFKELVVSRYSHMEVGSEEDVNLTDEIEQRNKEAMNTPPRELQTLYKPRVKKEDRNPNDPSSWGKIGRNETCPCGSNKKYKHCHGIES